MIKKDEYLNMRLPRADKDRLESMAKLKKRDVSDLAWVLISEGLDQLQKVHGTAKDHSALA